MMTDEKKYTVTENACKLCTPLGACLALKGIRGAVPLLHGSQGCSTYIRRYMISHFREPIDIASSNFSEDAAIFGGGNNLKTAITNIIRQYDPEVIGIPTTCLSETIGDDAEMIIGEYIREHGNAGLPQFISISTPSYKGTHMDGFHEAVLQSVMKLATEDIETENTGVINIFPGMVSPEDLRHLKEIITDFGLDYIMLPDYSDTLDGGLWSDYHSIPEGGTSVGNISRMGASCASIEFAGVRGDVVTPSSFLEKKFGVRAYSILPPVGINAADRFLDILSEISGRDIPLKYERERARLADSYADAHKYAFGLKAAVYGEEELIAGISSFLCETGIVPVLCASGSSSASFENRLLKTLPELSVHGTLITPEADFRKIEDLIAETGSELMVGNSKGYSISRKLGISLVRAGFPIHDRIGGQRMLHLGYRGTQQLFDRIINKVIETKQEGSPVGYSYM